MYSLMRKAVDLETNELAGLRGNQTLLKRIPFDPKLTYILMIQVGKYFKNPHYPLLLGRSTDLVTVSEIKEINLDKRINAKLGKTILPLGVNGAYGTIQALPTHFTDTIPRKAAGTKPFIMMSQFFEYSEECHYDEEMGWGIWFHR